MNRFTKLGIPALVAAGAIAAVGKGTSRDRDPNGGGAAKADRRYLADVEIRYWCFGHRSRFGDAGHGSGEHRGGYYGSDAGSGDKRIQRQDDSRD